MEGGSALVRGFSPDAIPVHPVFHGNLAPSHGLVLRACVGVQGMHICGLVSAMLMVNEVSLLQGC